MILAKISPSASIYKQSTPFDYTLESAEYMSIYAPYYVPNSDTTNFIIQFGNIPIPVNGEPSPPPFVSIYEMNISLTSDDLSIWGTDDKVLYSIVADKINIQIIGYA